MANTKKYTDAQRSRAIQMYAIGRSESGEYTDGTRWFSKGKYTLREISEETGIGLSAVNKIVKGG